MVVSMDVSAEARCIVLAMCAYVLIRTKVEMFPGSFVRSALPQMERVGFGRVLLEESVRVRCDLDYREYPTHSTVLASWFYYGCYLELAKENTAWFHLREATTQAHLLGMHDEITYRLSSHDAPLKRMLYWLLFIAER
jgi:hypothetical protein